MDRNFQHDQFREDFGLDGAAQPKVGAPPGAFDNDFPLLNASVAYSDHDHYRKDVKRKNLLEFFLTSIEADKYITTHMYGEMRKVDYNNPDESVNESILLQDLLNMSQQMRGDESFALEQTMD
mmetsp:Transcript_12476/g.20970  ORF Transcript_12476/g.20970 Transcript_12476/m.20970 type:complete len:123 (+) Transcript_12476:303-671(+)